MQESAALIAGLAHHLAVDAVGGQQVDAFLPDIFRLAHGDPDVGIQEIAALDAAVHIFRTGDAGTGPLGDGAGLFVDLVGGPQGPGRHAAEVQAQHGRGDHQGVAHIVAGIADVGHGLVLVGLVAMLAHGQKVRQDLGGVPFVGQAVPHRHAGKTGQLFHDALAKTAVFDAVIETGQHTGRIGHGFLFADLGTGGAQIGGVGTLVMGRHFKRATGPGGILFKQ